MGRLDLPDPRRDEDDGTFECDKCGDGSALRSGEACAYCAREEES